MQRRRYTAEFKSEGVKMLLIEGITVKCSPPATYEITGGPMKTSGLSARRDPELYHLLSLVDALRIGRARERRLAEKLIGETLNRHEAA